MAWTLYPISRFADVRHGWRTLNEADGNTPLLDPTFVGPLIDSFAEGQELIAIEGSLDRPCSMGILVRRGPFAWQTFQPGNAPLGAFLSDRSQPAVPNLELLVKALPRPCLMVGLSQVDPALVPRPEESANLKTMDYIPTARITASQSFETYWKSRSKNMRHDMKRQRNRLDREGIEPKLNLVTGESDIPAAVAEFGRLEGAGWKGQTGTAVDAENAQGRFYSAMLQAFTGRGEAVICQYYYGSELVASDLCLCRDGVLYVLKTAFDSSQKKTSPAQLMRQEAFAQMFDDWNIQTVEFYGRVMPWHRRWTDEIRTMYHLNYYRWSFLARLHSARIRFDK